MHAFYLPPGQKGIKHREIRPALSSAHTDRRAAREHLHRAGPNTAYQVRVVAPGEAPSIGQVRTFEWIAPSAGCTTLLRPPDHREMDSTYIRRPQREGTSAVQYGRLRDMPL